MRCKSTSVQASMLAVLVGIAAACGGGKPSPASGGAGGAATNGGDSRPSIVVTTSVLGDVVANLVGDRAVVEVVMPPGASPHEFQASARQAVAMRNADALITNGAGFEAGLEDVIESARKDGVATYEAISAVDTLARDDADHEAGRADEAGPGDGHREGHAGKDRSADDHDGADPHFFTDPRRMGVAARGIVDFLGARLPVAGADDSGGGPERGGPESWRDGAAPYLERLDALDAQAEAALARVPAVRRRLVTNHDVFDYFADRYGFDVIGVVVPGGGTQAGPDPARLDDLAAEIRATGIPAVFADTSSSADLAGAMAGEAGDVEVVELYSESLGPSGSAGATYLDMVRTNAERIAGALAGGGSEAAAR